MQKNKVCRWLDSNHGPLMLEATALPNELQPLPKVSPNLWGGVYILDPFIMFSPWVMEMYYIHNGQPQAEILLFCLLGRLQHSLWESRKVTTGDLTFEFFCRIIFRDTMQGSWPKTNASFQHWNMGLNLQVYTPFFLQVLIPFF